MKITKPSLLRNLELSSLFGMFYLMLILATNEADPTGKEFAKVINQADSSSNAAYILNILGREYKDPLNDNTNSILTMSESYKGLLNLRCIATIGEKEFRLELEDKESMFEFISSIDGCLREAVENFKNDETYKKDLSFSIANTNVFAQPYYSNGITFNYSFEEGSSSWSVTRYYQFKTKNNHEIRLSVSQSSNDQGKEYWVYLEPDIIRPFPLIIESDASKISTFLTKAFEVSGFESDAQTFANIQAIYQQECQNPYFNSELITTDFENAFKEVYEFFGISLNPFENIREAECTDFMSVEEVGEYFFPNE